MKIQNKSHAWKLAYCFCVTFFSTIMANDAHAGVVLAGTRVIYPEHSKEVTLPLKNASTSDTFLVQSVIENVNGDNQPHFVVTPPLFVLKPGGENKLRIFLKTVVPMPSDRESLFWMSVKAIPSVKKQQEGNFVQFAVTNKIKLLYRPAILASPDHSVWKKITISTRDNTVMLHNPTPYYMNIASVTAGALLLENLTLAPHETKAVNNTSQAAKRADVIFIDDFGGESDKVNVPIT